MSILFRSSLNDYIGLIIMLIIEPRMVKKLLSM